MNTVLSLVLSWFWALVPSPVAANDAAGSAPPPTQPASCGGGTTNSGQSPDCKSGGTTAKPAPGSGDSIYNGI